MRTPPRRHTNGDFARSISLLLADVLLSGLLGLIMLGLFPEDDWGLSVKLSPYYPETEDTLKIPATAILHLDINAASQLYIDSISYSHSSAERPIHNYLMKRYLQGKKSYLWIRVSKQSRYTHYLQLRDAIKRAERGILDELALKAYGYPYTEDFPFLWRRTLNSQLSLCIIEEDPEGTPHFELRSFSDCYDSSQAIWEYSQ